MQPKYQRQDGVGRFIGTIVDRSDDDFVADIYLNDPNVTYVWYEGAIRSHSIHVENIEEELIQPFAGQLCALVEKAMEPDPSVSPNARAG